MNRKVRLGSAPFQNANGRDKRRKRLEKLFKLSNKCYYCGVETYLPERGNNKPVYYPNMATIEHLFCKYDIRRPLTTFSSHTVLACFQCNKQKGYEADLRPTQQEYKGLLISLLNQSNEKYIIYEY